MLPLVFHFIYLLIFSQISSFSTENVLAKTFLQHVFKFHPHNACDQIICCSQPVAVGPSPSPASAPSVAPRLSVAGIFGLTCGMTMPRETNHSHNFKTISNCATSSASFSCSPSVRIPSIYSSASSPLTFQPFLGFWVFCFFDFCVSSATGQTQMLRFGFADPGMRDRRLAAVERVLRLYGQRWEEYNMVNDIMVNIRGIF